MQEYSDLSVLLIDPSQHMRSGLHNMLGQLGITRIEHGVSAGTAIRLLEKKAFDLVFCEYDLGNEHGQDGQQLLEDLRHNKLISPSTILIMLTTEGVYSKDVSAADLTPTDYILKPFTVDVLAQRIARAVDRRGALLPIHQMIERNRLREAILSSVVAAAANPRYATEFHPFSGGTLLEIRHPSLGWMDFVLPSVERIRITRSLTEQEETWKRFRR